MKVGGRTEKLSETIKERKRETDNVTILKTFHVVFNLMKEVGNIFFFLNLTIDFSYRTPHGVYTLS